MAEDRCPEIAIVNVNVGVARCYLPEGHEGEHQPHPSFWDYV